MMDKKNLIDQVRIASWSLQAIITFLTRAGVPDMLAVMPKENEDEEHDEYIAADEVKTALKALFTIVKEIEKVTTYENLFKLIINEKEKREIGNREFSEMVGCTYQSMCDYIDGRRAIPLDILFAMLIALGYIIKVTK